jgi:hypothetical protein
MSGPNFDMLSANQVKAIALLRAGYSVGRAAKKIDVNRTTVWRWLKRGDFLQALREAKRDNYYETLELIAKARSMQLYATLYAQQPPIER